MVWSDFIRLACRDKLWQPACRQTALAYERMLAVNAIFRVIYIYILLMFELSLTLGFLQSSWCSKQLPSRHGSLFWMQLIAAKRRKLNLVNPFFGSSSFHRYCKPVGSALFFVKVKFVWFCVFDSGVLLFYQAFHHYLVINKL